MCTIMSDEGLKRKLTAILSADMEGYSRLWTFDDSVVLARFYGWETKLKLKDRIIMGVFLI